MEVEEYTLSQSCLNEFTKNSFAELMDEQDNINFLLNYFTSEEDFITAGDLSSQGKIKQHTNKYNVFSVEVRSKDFLFIKNKDYCFEFNCPCKEKTILNGFVYCFHKLAVLIAFKNKEVIKDSKLSEDAIIDCLVDQH